MKVIIEIVLRLVPLIRKFLKERNRQLSLEISKLELDNEVLTRKLFGLKQDQEEIQEDILKTEKILILLDKRLSQEQERINEINKDIQKKKDEIQKLSDDDIFDMDTSISKSI